MPTSTGKHALHPRKRTGTRAFRRRLARTGSLTAAVCIVTLPAAPMSAAASQRDPASGAPVVGFDARANASPYNYCLDIPQVLIGQKICGGGLQSDSTATSDPRGLALAGIAPVPKASSLSLAIPNRIPLLNAPIPPEVTDSIKKFEFENTPLQCQAVYPPVRPVDADRTCGGPTAGDGQMGFVASGSNARVQSTGASSDPMSTHTVAQSRAYDISIPGLQSTTKNTYSLAESGIDRTGVPTATADLRTQEFDFAAGLLNIEGLRSQTSVATDGTRAGTRVSSLFSYASATVFGVPVTITTKGLQLAGQLIPDSLAPTYTKVLNDALASIPSLSIRLLPAPPVADKNGLISAQSAGIEITYRSNKDNGPFKGTPLEGEVHQILGQSVASVSAVADDAASSDLAGTTTQTTGPLGPDHRTALTPADTGDPQPPATFPAAAPAESLLPGPGDANTATLSPTEISIGGGVRAQFAAANQTLSVHGVRNLYPGLVLLVLVTFLATRLRRRSSPLAPNAGFKGSTS
jgi:hypothetical protein